MTTEPELTRLTQPHNSTEALRLLRDDAVRHAFDQVELVERIPHREYLARYRDQLAAAASHARATMPPLTVWPGAGQSYLRTMTRDGNFTRVRRVLDFVVPGDRVLDIGSGRGYLSGVLLRDTPLRSYTGIDIAASHLASARSMIEANHLGERSARFEVRDVYDLTPDWVAQHDPSLVIMLEMLEHLPDAERGLATVARCLSDDTALLFSVPLRGRLENVWGHLSVFDVPRVRRMCRQAGLYIQHVEIIFGTWALVLATRSEAVDPRVLQLARQEPPTSVPATPIREFVAAVTRRTLVLRARSGARQVEMSADRDGAHVRVVGSANPFRPQYGGVSFDVAGDLAIRLELAFERGRSIRNVFVDLVDAEGNRAARWVWRCGLLRSTPSSKKQTFLLAPGRPALRFRPVGPSRPGVATTANVSIEVLPTRTAGFRLTRAASLRDRPA